jgi:hypothetical protein
MFTPPPDLDTWDPRHVTDWLAELAEDDTLTPGDWERAQRVVTAALLGEELAAELHGPETR